MKTEGLSEAVRFRILFRSLRDTADDIPSELERIAAEDEVIRRRCSELSWIAYTIKDRERNDRELFRTSERDDRFISEWRDYEARYDAIVSRFLLDLRGIDLGAELESPEDAAGSAKSNSDIAWANADDEGEEVAKSIKWALAFALDQATQEGRDFPDDLPESVEDGVIAWQRLVEQTGFDIRASIRRRALVPFVVIPRHVSNRHGSAETVSLFTHLRQAHDAFILGVPFGALAMMRALLELVLKEHYRAEGRDLNELINNCRDLPAQAPRQILHRIREWGNRILHFDKGQRGLSSDMEKQTIVMLRALRALIENAPDLRPPKASHHRHRA